MATTPVFILGLDELIQPDDWIRPLFLTEDEDGVSHDYTIWGGSPLNNMKWCQVKDVLGKPWHGKTIKEYYTFAAKSNSGRGFPIVEHFEFLRGTPPVSHQLKHRRNPH